MGSLGGFELGGLQDGGLDQCEVVHGDPGG